MKWTDLSSVAVNGKGGSECVKHNMVSNLKTKMYIIPNVSKMCLSSVFI